MQAIAPAPPGHEPAGEFVDDDHLTVLDDVLLVLVVERLRLHGVVEVVHRGDVALVEVLHAEQPLRARDALLGEVGRVVLLLHDVVALGLELRRDARERVVRLGRVLGRRADDERRARLVDEDRVRLVDDRVVEPALHLVGELHEHVVAQVVEPELAVLPVGDVRAVRLGAAHIAPVPVPPVDGLELDERVVDRALLVRDEGDTHPERVIDRRHPARTGLRQVVVRGH